MGGEPHSLKLYLLWLHPHQPRTQLEAQKTDAWGSLVVTVHEDHAEHSINLGDEQMKLVSDTSMSATV